MAGRAKTPDATAPPGDRQSPDSRISASKATLYLSAAPHLRRGMFRRRPPRPVGRSFAVRALFGADRVVPMPAVDIGEVRRQCAIALLQTVLRDLAVVAALAVSAALEPWGTLVVFGFAIVVIALIGRVPLISWLTFAVIVASLLLLFSGIYHGHRFLAIPLSCLGACFAVYLADTLLSVHHVRKLWRRARLGPDGLAGTDDERKGLRVGQASRDYHDNHRIIGAGTLLRPVDFSVGVIKTTGRRTAGKKIQDLGPHHAHRLPRHLAGRGRGTGLRTRDMVAGRQRSHAGEPLHPRLAEP